jgi:hypothetical protein
VSDIRGDRRYAVSGCRGAVWKSKRHWTGRIAMHFQVDGENLNNRLNVTDFGRPVFRQCYRASAKRRAPG